MSTFFCWIREKNNNHKRCLCVRECVLLNFRTFGHISRYRDISFFCLLWLLYASWLTYAQYHSLHLGAILILNHISVRPVIIWGRRYRCHYRIHIYSPSLGCYCSLIIENSFYSFAMTNLKILMSLNKRWKKFMFSISVFVFSSIDFFLFDTDALHYSICESQICFKLPLIQSDAQWI